MRSLIASLIILLPAVAGCIAADDPDKAKSTVNTTVDPNSEFGLVSGTVIDDEARGIKGAEVALRDTEFLTRTDEEGRFQFLDVLPGEYIIDAARLGYEPAVTKVTVVAGQEVIVQGLRLALLATVEETYFKLTQFRGFYDCALGAVVWISACSYPYTAAVLALRDGTCVEPPACTPPVINLTQYGVPEDIQNNPFRYNWTLEPGSTDVVSEMMWEATSAASTRMYLDLDCGDYDPVWDDCVNPDGRYNYADTEGESPLRVVWNTEDIEVKPTWVMARGYLPFYDPQVALSQPFDIYNAAFYHGEAPEDFTSLPKDA